MRKGSLCGMVFALCMGLCACGGERKTDREAVDDVQTQESAAVGTSEVVESKEADENTQAAEIDCADLYSLMPREYSFLSGAGGWSTELYLAGDGSFEGNFHDSDMGDTGEGYPGGTLYLCDFKGKFAKPEKVNGHIYRTRVENLEWDRSESQEIVDGVLCIYTSPYGLCEDAEILIYLPGTPIREIDGEFMSWTFIRSEEREFLPESFYGIYNVTEGLGFTALEQDCLWNSLYSGENAAGRIWVSPSYDLTYLEVESKRDPQEKIFMHFKWDYDDQTDFAGVVTTFAESDWKEEEKYDLHFAFDEERTKCTLTITSRDGEDMTGFGGTADGTLTMELTRGKGELD